MGEGERGLSYKALPPFFASARAVWLSTEKREFSERIPFRRSALFLSEGVLYSYERIPCPDLLGTML